MIIFGFMIYCKVKCLSNALRTTNVSFLFVMKGTDDSYCSFEKITYCSIKLNTPTVIWYFQKSFYSKNLLLLSVLKNCGKGWAVKQLYMNTCTYKGDIFNKIVSKRCITKGVYAEILENKCILLVIKLHCIWLFFSH